MNLEILRQKIQSIEWHDQKSDAVFSFGAKCIDDALPKGGLKSGGVHEWTGPYKGPLTGICASLLGRLAKQSGPILWCSTQIDLYPLGLLNYGLSPEQVIFAKLDNAKEVLWAVEEGLGAAQLGAVIAEVGAISLAAHRRLQLCAQKSGVTLFLLIDKKHENALSQATSRWAVEPLPSRAAPGLWQDNGVGAPRFAITLSRCRGAMTPQTWKLEWNATTLSFDLLYEPQELLAASGS